jgi:ankyrin repeat protein
MKPAYMTIAVFVAAWQCVAADSNAADRLFAFIRNDDIAGLTKAIREGADVNSRADRDTTPLMYAAAFGSLDALKLLKRAGARVNAQNAFGATALMWSVTETAKVRLLLDAGADVNARSSTGRTALLLAALHNGSDSGGSAD